MLKPILKDRVLSTTPTYTITCYQADEEVFKIPNCTADGIYQFCKDAQFCRLSSRPRPAYTVIITKQYFTDGLTQTVAKFKSDCPSNLKHLAKGAQLWNQQKH